jgi:iron complex outermembrane recepter protein
VKVDYRPSISMTSISRRCLLIGGVLLAPALAWAQDTLPRTLPPVVVIRDRARSTLELPYGITSVRPDSISPGQTHTQVEQTLAFVPGLTTANRTNPSQDTRVSIRGFGARSPFGVRSVRVLRDGMPLTLPDGQTPLDYLDLESVDRVEVIRGSASALYGNASGGVIDLRSGVPPSPPIAAQLRTWRGSYDTKRNAVMLGGTTSRVAYSGNLGRTTSEGYRHHARQRLNNGFGRAIAEVLGTELGVTAMGLDMPLAENPGALTFEQYETNPELADPSAVVRRARKEVHQLQIGVSARRPMRDDGDVFLQAYGSGRNLFNPLTFAIVGIDRRSSGVSARATLPVDVGRTRHRFTVGADGQRLDDERKNWMNCTGTFPPTTTCPLSVERGPLQLDQREVVTSVGPYVRDEIALNRLRLSAGARVDNITFEVRDAFLEDGVDNSGQRTMRAISPTAGIALRLSGRHTTYVSYASAFETPTTTELANRADGSAGFSTDVDPQYSRTFEGGIKGSTLALQYDAALFTTTVRDELVPFRLANGRDVFRNAGRTRRQGMELSVQTGSGPLVLTAAYTFSRFRFVNFRVNDTTEHSGKTIPGVPRHQAQGNLTWSGRYGFATSEWLAKSRVHVNDANTGTARGYAIVNMRAGARAIFGEPWLMPVVGIQNVFNRKYVGSVAINAAGTPFTGKFYEPAPGRSWFVGVSAATTPW